MNSSNLFNAFEPFEDMYVDRGSLVIEFLYGVKCRFRYQDNDWYLIGYTDLLEHSRTAPQFSISQDFNLLTGDYEERGLNNKLIVEKKHMKLAKKPLINLKDFKLNEIDSYSLIEYLKDDTTNIYEFIPKGYKILKIYNGTLAIAKGHFDNNDTMDIAFVLEHKEDDKIPGTLMTVYYNCDGVYSITNEALIDKNTLRDFYVDDNRIVIKCTYNMRQDRNYISYVFNNKLDNWFLESILLEKYEIINDQIYYQSDEYSLSKGTYNQTILNNDDSKTTTSYIQNNQSLKLSGLDTTNHNYATLVREYTKMKTQNDIKIYDNLIYTILKKFQFMDM